MFRPLGRLERMDSAVNKYDIWIAGAGYAGAVSARALAEKGKKVLVLEQIGRASCRERV